LPTLQMLVTG